MGCAYRGPLFSFRADDLRLRPKPFKTSVRFSSHEAKAKNFRTADGKFPDYQRWPVSGGGSRYIC